MIEASLGLNISAFSAGLSKAKDAISKAGSSMGAGFTLPPQAQAALAALAVAATAAGIAIAGTLSAMKEGKELQELSDQTGISTGRLFELGKAAERVGIGADQVPGILGKMQKAIYDTATGSGSAALAFSTLGVKISSLVKMSAEDQMQTLGNALKNIQNPTERAAIAMEVFGKKGAIMLRLFEKGGVTGLGKSLSSEAQLFQDNAGIFAEVSSGLQAVGVEAKGGFGFFTGLASRVAGDILPIIGKLESFDFSQWGKDIGDAISPIIEPFKRAKDLSLAIGESLGVALAKAIEFSLVILWEGLKGVFKGIAALLIGLFASTVTLISDLLSVFDSAETKAKKKAKKDAAVEAANMPLRSTNTEGSGADFTRKPIFRLEAITSSLGKVGGGGGFVAATVGNQNELLNQSREQVNQQRETNKILSEIKASKSQVVETKFSPIPVLG